MAKKVNDLAKSNKAFIKYVNEQKGKPKPLINDSTIAEGLKYMKSKEYIMKIGNEAADYASKKLNKSIKKVPKKRK